MFWNKIAFAYDLFENIYNKNVYNQTGKAVADIIGSDDEVLECACGTGAISIFISEKCRQLTATDFSVKMLAKAGRKLAGKTNVTFEEADITNLPYEDASFDAVVAGNVIHLLPDPKVALKELERVCRKTGKLIIPTYINDSAESSRLAVKFLEKLGADFKRQFDAASYEKFFANMGYKNVKYSLVEGRMSCYIATIELGEQ